MEYTSFVPGTAGNYLAPLTTPYSFTTLRAKHLNPVNDFPAFQCQLADARNMETTPLVETPSFPLILTIRLLTKTH